MNPKLTIKDGVEIAQKFVWNKSLQEYLQVLFVVEYRLDLSPEPLSDIKICTCNRLKELMEEFSADEVRIAATIVPGKMKGDCVVLQ